VRFVPSPTPLVRELVKVKDSYNCDALSLIAATAAIEDQEYLRTTRARLLATRERMTIALRELGFCDSGPGEPSGASDRIGPSDRSTKH
jgi:histidinol-phosphate aminotransferase